MGIFNGSDNPVLKKFAANTGWLVAQNVFQYVLSAVIGIIAARYMGPGNYGILTYGAAMMTLFSPFCTLSLNDVQIPCMIDTPEDTGKIIGSAVVMRLVSTALSITALLLLVSLMKPGDKLMLLVTALQSLQLIIQVCDAFRLWFQMKLMSKYTAIGSVIGNIACSAWRIGLLIQGASVEWFALTSVIQMLANYLFVLPMFAKLAHVRLGVSRVCMKRLWKRGYQLILAEVTVVVANRIGTVLLGNMLDEAAVGLYNAGLNIAMMWLFVTQSFVDSANPVLLKTNHDQPEAFWPRYQVLLLTITGISLLAGLGLTVLSPWIVELLYGPKYALSANVLRITGWVGIFSSIGTARNIWTLAKEKQKYVKYFCMVSAAASILLNFILIRLMGMMGAAVAILLVNVIQALVAPLFWKESREFVTEYFAGFARFPEMIRELKNLFAGKKGEKDED
jgi:O-antigen/teichoic acid export membrane protein